MKRNGIVRAAACIHGGSAHPGIRGKVCFSPHRGGTLVTAEIWGLPASAEGFFGFHIHEGRCCCGEGFANTLGHFNPHDTTHPRHAGDLPPLLSCGGHAWMSIFTDRFCPEDILGRTVVIHSHPDDFRTQPAGDSGEKIACGKIVPK